MNIPIANVVVWVNRESKKILIAPHLIGDEAWGVPEEHGYRGHWADPIGAAYAEWRKYTDDQRTLLMTETVIDLVVQGFDLHDVLKAFAQVPEFRALGRASMPMSRALTWALIGKILEPNAMTFDELLEEYRNEPASP